MRLSISLLALAVFALPNIGYAHGDGASYEVEKSGYKIDIGYSPENVTDGEGLVLDFKLQDKNNADVSFSDVWVKIESEDKTVVFASGIHNVPFGGPRISYVFPDSGTYTISARYEQGSNSIVEASFPITVSETAEEGGSPMTQNFIWGALGLLIGAATIRMLPFRTKEPVS